MLVLQRAIQILQLSKPELQELVQQELLENPLLEEAPSDPLWPASDEPHGALGEAIVGSSDAADTLDVIPDVFVYKMGDDYTVVLNEDGIPRLRVNSLYRSLLRGSGQEAKQYVEQKLRSAIWLIKSVHQRQRTLYRVTESIVKFQRDFLDKGLASLRPLSLRDVGKDIGMHESTISRVTTNKYVQTPQGLFELKSFFHRGNTGEEWGPDDFEPDGDGDPLDPPPPGGGGFAQVSLPPGAWSDPVARYLKELETLFSHRRRLAPKKR